MKSAFESHFFASPAVVVRSPGRINLIGEHTDYNEGFVFPAAIDLAMTIEVGPGQISSEVFAADLNEQFLINFNGGNGPVPSWAKYVLGMIVGLGPRNIPPTQIAFGGDIPVGAGLSSSAALCVGIGLALNELHGLGLERAEIARIAQQAEHEFAGVNCGLMDQYASLFGRAGHFLKLDCRDLSFEYVPADLGEYSLVLCDSRVKHSLAESAYNQRRAECAEGLRLIQRQFPQVQSLRDADLKMLKTVGWEMSPEVALRCKYVIEENARVGFVADALQKGEIKTVGEYLYATHAGLQHDYAVSCAELDFLVDLTRSLEYVAGARLMGGGFGGCTLNVVNHNFLDQFEAHLKSGYERNFGITPHFYPVKISDGGSIVKS
ncbi:MAG: galactokinase [Bacteroidia bacterium]|nr:galactokinase [Bacteroidia bacterium]